MITVVHCLLLLSSCLAFAIMRRPRHSSRCLPPGPPALPIIGNLLHWPLSSGWLKFTEWANVYGDVVYLNIFGVKIIILNSIEASLSIMNGANCANRPTLAMAGQLMGFEPSIVLSPYNEHWKLMRKLIRPHLTRAACKWLQHSQILDSRLLLRMLLDRPSDYLSSLRFIVGKNVIGATYGIDIHSPDDKLLSLAEKAHNTLSYAVVPGRFLVDIFPSLKRVPVWFPGAGFRRLAAAGREYGAQMAESPLMHVKRSLATGTPETSIVASMLQEEAPEDICKADYDYAIKWAAVSLYGAGTETVVSALSTFFLMMAVNPEVQQKAQEELDRVVGKERLPNFDDREDLPYIEAIIKETLRINPPAPLGIAHQLVRDGVYEGRHLPGGSIVIANIWAMSQNSRCYDDSRLFKPERFLKGEASADMDPASYVFGFGRRSCVGIQYTTAVLYIKIASILSVFLIKKHDKDGHAVEVMPSFTGGFISHPDEFPCRIVSRSDVAERLIRALP